MPEMIFFFALTTKREFTEQIDRVNTIVYSMPYLNNVKEIGVLNYLRNKFETQKCSSYIRAKYSYQKQK